jgi:hypothetical protein
MRFVKGATGVVVCVSLLAGCASQWKIQGGPKECMQMCAAWDMELTGMVGVGNQDASGPGATACVCQPRKTADAPGATAVGSPGAATGMSAAIVALQEAERQQRQQQSQATK